MKDLHGQKNIYYQVNATYFSALGEDERKMLLARALADFYAGQTADLVSGSVRRQERLRSGEDGRSQADIKRSIGRI